MDARRPAEGVSRFPAGLTITGDVTSGDDLIIDGTVDGQITMPDREVTISESARVKAKLVARTVMVAGHLEGSIAATRVVLRATASVAAHVQTPSLVMQDGARLNGTVDPDRNAAAVHVARYRQSHPEGAEPPKAESA